MKDKVRDSVCIRCFRSHQLHGHAYGKTYCEDGFEVCADYPYNNNFVWIKVFPLNKEVVDVLKKQKLTEKQLKEW